MLEQDHSNSAPLTIDKVFSALKHWREHKNEYASTGIPKDVWLMIFQLENNGYSAAEIKRLFTLNSSQYAKKKQQLSNNIPTQIPAAPQKSQVSTTQQSDNDIDFCETTVKQSAPQKIPTLAESANQTKQAVSQLKSTQNHPQGFLDLTTIIVECIRPDGHRLKIHTTTQSLDKVMEAFYRQGGEGS